MEIQKRIQEKLLSIIQEMGVTQTRPSVERPKNLLHADFTSNIAMVLAKQLHQSPLELASTIEKKLSQDLPEGVSHVRAVAPGYLNFELTTDLLITDLGKLLKADSAYLTIDQKKKIIVEYSSPNIAKPFTIGHLRSTVIGDAVANLLEAVGHEVYRDNHIGDWGTQFGKQIYAIKAIPLKEEFAGDEIGVKNEAMIEKSDRPVKLLVELYVKFHEEAEKNPALEDEGRAWFKKLEDGDPEARSLWQKCIDWSWKEFDAIYKELGVPSSGKTFENNGRGYGEAYFEDKMEEPIKELKDKGLLKEGKEGAKIVEFPEETKLTPLMILKKDGASLYATRDLATDMFRLKKYGSDIVIINEVGAEQALYWQQVYTLESMLGWYKKEQRVHIKHGMYRFREGKMSTRKGNVIWLEDVLEEAKKRAFEITRDTAMGINSETRDVVRRMNEIIHKPNKGDHLVSEEEAKRVSSTIGIGAIKWNDLKRNSVQDINFDWDDVLSMQGNSGPYMQYVAVRCKSVLAKAGVNVGDIESWSFDIVVNLQSEESLLLRMLGMYPEVLQQAAREYAPHVLCTYLFELAQTFNNFYQKLPILKEEEQVRKFRLFLTHATGMTITKGLQVLGIAVPERM